MKRPEAVWRKQPIVAGVPLRLAEPMALHTTLGIGGPADYYAVVYTQEQLLALVQWACGEGLPYRVIGSGANLLVADEGVPGLVIENRINYCYLCLDTGLVRVGSGVTLSDLALYTAKRGWAGLEWAIGIPGTVGGAIVGNAGAFGGYIGDVVQEVTVLDAQGRVCALSATECGFVYRGSRFKRAWGERAQGANQEVILAAVLALRRAAVNELGARLQEYEERRARSQPMEPSAGSIFKRTSQYPAGWLIEQVGLKGTRIGGAQISPQHANFIVNLGGATAADVLALIDLAKRRVQERFGVELELEIEVL